MTEQLPPTSLSPSRFPKANDDIAKLKEAGDKEGLYKIASEAITKTAAWYFRTGLALLALKELGEDIYDLQNGMTTYLLATAEGRVLPEVLAKFIGRPLLLPRICALDLAEQKRLAEGGTVQVFEWTEGKEDKRLLSPLEMKQQEINQAFEFRGGTCVVRNLGQQMRYLEAKKKRVKRSNQFGNVRVDVAKGVIIGKGIVTPHEYTLAVAVLSESKESSDPPDEPEDKPASASLTESQHRRLRENAAKAGISVADMVRKALRAYGLI